MAYKFDVDTKCFTFIWFLENFEYCEEKIGENFDSPTFIVDTIERSKWSLSIYPRGEESDEFISLYLNREEDSKGPARIKIDFELAFLAPDGLVLTSERRCDEAFLKDEESGFSVFEKRETVINRKLEFLPQGSLTIRCRIWKSIGEVQMPIQCIGRTRIGVEKKVFLWKIRDFSTLSVGREIVCKLKSTLDYEPIVSLILFPPRDNWIHIHLANFQQNIVFATLLICLVDSKGRYVDCNQCQLFTSPAVPSIGYVLPSSIDKLMNNKSLYLSNDVLTLYCEFAFSSGILSEVIEETSHGCSSSSKDSNIVLENKNSATIEKSESDTSDLKMDLGSMLHDNTLCDVKLCSESETFPAHWFILSARSPVFRAMFQSDMKEKARGRIDIKDLKPDTLRRMLHYMYTNALEELQFDTAFDLYTAAEKYQIMGLKNKCSAFLKSNLSLTNSCEVLLLADLHQDKELKSATQNFILENYKSIFNSNEWKQLMEANLNLSAETMLLRFKE